MSKKTRKPNFFAPEPGQYWPVVKYHLTTVYMTLWIWALIQLLDWAFKR